MAYKLQTSVFQSGLENQAAQQLCCLKFFSTLATPVTEAVMRSSLETGQFQAFSNAGWASFLQSVAALPLVDASLTTAERSIVNTIFSAIVPPPQLQCCGVVIPSFGDGLTATKGYPRIGSATFEHTIEVELSPTLTCNIKSIFIT